MSTPTGRSRKRSRPSRPQNRLDRLRVISGGQTGVDRAALDAAFELALECGGWVPAGRRAEDGPVDARYPLRETAAGDYETRTRLNVRDSDATLILTRGRPSGGTALTVPGPMRSRTVPSRP